MFIWAQLPELICLHNKCNARYSTIVYYQLLYHHHGPSKRALGPWSPKYVISIICTSHIVEFTKRPYYVWVLVTSSKRKKIKVCPPQSVLANSGLSPAWCYNSFALQICAACFAESVCLPAQTFGWDQPVRWHRRGSITISEAYPVFKNVSVMFAFCHKFSIVLHSTLWALQNLYRVAAWSYRRVSFHSTNYAHSHC